MKKKRKIKIRRGWKIKPVVKVKVSAKVYRRQKDRDRLRKEIYDVW